MLHGPRPRPQKLGATLSDYVKLLSQRYRAMTVVFECGSKLTVLAQDLSYASRKSTLDMPDSAHMVLSVEDFNRK